MDLPQSQPQSQQMDITQFECDFQYDTKTKRLHCKMQHAHKLIGTFGTAKCYWVEDSMIANRGSGYLTANRPDKIGYGYAKFYLSPSKRNGQIVLYRNVRINFDVCVNFRNYTQKDNREIPAKVTFLMKPEQFLKNYNHYICNAFSYGTALIAQKDKYPVYKQTENQKLLNVYPEYEQWFFDYEYGGCTSSEEDGTEIEVQVDRLKINNGILEHYIATIKQKPDN